MTKFLLTLPPGKTLLAAAGLAGLSLWLLSQGQYENSLQAFLNALAALGLRAAMEKDIAIDSNRLK